MKAPRLSLKPLNSIFSTVFGVIQWSPPKWPRRLPLLLSAQAANPRRRRQAAVVTAAALVAAAVRFWYLSLPQPHYVDFIATVPGAMPLQEGALPEPLLIRFDNAVAPLEMIGKEVKSGISLSPAVPGTWSWTNDSELTFTPAAEPLDKEKGITGPYWLPGQDYRIELSEELFAPGVRLPRYQQTVSTTPFTAEITKAEFYEDPRSYQTKQVVATVRFSHPVEKSDFERKVRLVLNRKAGAPFDDKFAKSIGFRISYDSFAGEAYVHSDPLPVPEDDCQMMVMVEKAVHPQEGPSRTADPARALVNVPSRYNYLRVNSVETGFVKNDRYESERVVMVETNLPISRSELETRVYAVLLPTTRPAFQGRPSRSNYHWSDTTEIGPEVLQYAEAVPLEWLPSEERHSTVQSFRYKAPSGRYLYLLIDRGVTTPGGYVLKKEHPRVLRVPPPPREVTITHSGAVLSLHGAKMLSVLVRDIPAVQFEAARLLPRTVQFLKTMNYGTFANPSFSYSFRDYITERFTKEEVLPQAEPGVGRYLSFDFSTLLAENTNAPRGLFLFRVSGWNPVTKQVESPSDERLVLITDLGILAKDQEDGSHELFIQSLSTGEPAVGAEVSILGANGVPLLTEVSDDGGRVRFPNLKGFVRERQPSVYLVQLGADFSFLPYKSGERTLELSRFDTGGIRQKDAPQDLQAYLFSDRGMYRPGEEFRAGIIVKAQKWERPLAGVPLELSLTDPRGVEIHTSRLVLSPEGFHEYRRRTFEHSLTGQYQLSLFLVRDGRRNALLSSTSMRLEEFLPDTMRISSAVLPERRDGWSSPEGLTLRVKLENLFGTPAAERVIQGRLRLSPQIPAFRGFERYTFSDPSRAEQSFEQELPPMRTDKDGVMSLPLDLLRWKPATYRLELLTEGFEAEGGRSVRSFAQALISPNPFLIGYKPDGALDYLSRGSTRRLELVAVSPALERLAVDLQAELLELRWISVLKRQPDGTFSYESIRKEEPLRKFELSVPAEGATVPLPTDEPGSYALVLRDAAGTEYNRVLFTVAGKGNVTRSLERNAELELHLAKSDYAPGEEIELSIKAPFHGAGLITIERDRVYQYRWFKTAERSTIQTIRVPEELEGNAYVHVSFLRALDSPEIFMSPLSYAVQPFTIKRSRRTIPIELDLPAAARPGESLPVRYSAPYGGKMLLFAVDEGILQAARYRTPDPLSSFFAKRALEVQTSQILDLLLPEYTVIGSLKAPGGGEDALLAGNLNPFKRKHKPPVAFWSGMIDLTPGEATLAIPVPDYFSGQLRVMAVAVSNERIGVAAKPVTVRNEITIMPHTPLFLAPGDEAVVSATVTNSIAGSGAEARLTLSLSGAAGLEVLDTAERELTIPEGTEATVRYRVRAGERLGEATLVFAARTDRFSAKVEESISVRPAAPFLTSISGGYVTDGTASLPARRVMYPEYRRREVSASTIPLGLAQGLLVYLENYPFSCTEQLVSQAFAEMLFPRAQRADTFERALSVLAARQNEDGAFGYWAANSHTSEFVTAYAVHFLTESVERGHPVPPSLFNAGMRYLEKVARRQEGLGSDLRVRSYALYILSRNGMLLRAETDELRRALDKEYHGRSMKDEPAAIYLAATYKLQRRDREAFQVLPKQLITEEPTPSSDLSDRMAWNARLLDVLALHFPERLKTLPAESLQLLVEPILSNRQSSLSAALTLLAFSHYAEVVGAPGANEVVVEEKHGNQPHAPLALRGSLFLTGGLSPEAKELRFSIQGNYPLFYQLTEAGFDRTQPTAALRQGLEVHREYRDAEGNPVTAAKLGEDLYVYLRVRALGDTPLHHIALVDLLSAGLEIDLQSAGAAFRSNASYRGYGWSPEKVDFREDRALLFGTVGPQAAEYVYRVSANTRGTFVVPPLFAESMYDRRIQGRSLAGTLTIE